MAAMAPRLTCLVSLPRLANLLQVSFQFRNDDVYQARGEWIGHLSLQETIALDLSF